MTEENTAPQETAPQKFVAIVPKPEGTITISFEGMDIEEARRVIAFGYAKFEKEYDLYVRRTVR